MVRSSNHLVRLCGKYMDTKNIEVTEGKTIQVTFNKENGQILSIVLENKSYTFEEYVDFSSLNDISIVVSELW